MTALHLLHPPSYTILLSPPPPPSFLLLLSPHISSSSPLPSPDVEEEVEFEAGLKRGKVFIPVLTTEEQEEQRKKAEIAEKVK